MHNHIDIEQMIANMTLRQKIGQLNQVPSTLENLEPLKEKIQSGEIGSIILATSSTAGNEEQVRTNVHAINELERVAMEESPFRIPVIFGRDVIHGHHTVLPIPLALAATFNPELVRNSYRAVAREAANDGIQWTFSPMLDLSRDPRWGRCIEGPGEDPYLGAQMAEAVVRGFQGDDPSRPENLAACLKHYIGYGVAEGGRDYGQGEISDYSLRNYYLPAFKKGVEAGVATVMNSFVSVGGDAPAGSRYLLNDLLKEELGFDGFVISDWDAVVQLINQGIAEDAKEASEISINAGMDMDMADQAFITHLEQLVQENRVSMETIDNAVRRVLSVKARFGLFDHPFVPTLPIEEEAHTRLAENCSDEAMVLLKNNGILPLSKDQPVFVSESFAFDNGTLLGGWTLDGDRERTSTIAEAIAQKSPAAKIGSPCIWEFSLCYSRECPKAPIVLVFGEGCCMSSEAGYVTDINFPQDLLERVKKLRRLGTPLIAVMCFGRPIAMENVEEYFDAILYAWHSGTRTAQSVASILYGDVNPSGKLPMTFPRCTGQIPLYYNYYPSGRCPTYYYTDDRTACPYTYRDSLSTPLYPFGYGLSYTTFAYSNVTCDHPELHLSDLKNGAKFVITADVRNTGTRDGKETSQCYIHDVISNPARPIRELKGFSKNEIPAGSCKTVSFSLGFEELGFYHPSRDFTVDPGRFDVYVGTDSYAAQKVSITVLP